MSSAAMIARPPDHLVAAAIPPARPVRSSQRGFHPSWTYLSTHSRHTTDHTAMKMSRVAMRDCVTPNGSAAAKSRARSAHGGEAEPPAQRVDAGEQRDAGDHRRDAPAERPVTEQQDAGGDGELAHLRVRP